jgi:phosphomannomutase
VSADVQKLSAFKAYDVRGRVPDELNPEMATLIGRAFARLVRPRRVVVGRDMRLTGHDLTAALCHGLLESGVDVVDIRQVGTEQVYYATFALGLDGGIMVTASHNPADYNGMKFVREKAIPLSADTGLAEMERMVALGLRGEGEIATGPAAGALRGALEWVDTSAGYAEHLLGYVDVAALCPLKIVANVGNGMAGAVLELLRAHLPFEFITLYPIPDGTFPHGVPNPLLPENREVTATTVREVGADLGLAWDGDFDRCFFYDERGKFIDGYYLVGLLAQQALLRSPGAAIVHDPRLVWNTEELVREAGGRPVVNKSGHAFIKERMRREDAAYGGEMSAHHYFRDFSYCDSGMIPWLLVAELLSKSGKKLSELVEERMRRYPISGEINLELADPAGAMAKLREAYEPGAVSVDDIDGISLEFPTWRLNVRMSNTEPVVRVNLESRGDRELVRNKTEEVLAFLRNA